jgi:transposase
MALFGAQSEDVEKTLLKVQSAMALSQGLQSVGESIDSFKQLGAVLKSTSAVQKVMTATTAAYTFVNQAATTGLKLFRLALIGTGIGAIVVGLGLLIANFDKVKETIMKVIPGLSSVGKVIGGIVNSITDFVGATSDASRALDKLKENADKTLSVNKKFMQEHGDQVDQYTKKKIDAKNAYAEAVKEEGANEAELAKKLNRELAAIEYSRGDEKRKIQKDASDKAAEDRKSQNEKLKNEREDEAKKLKEEKDKAVISEAEAFRNQLEAVQKVEADAKKANADALLTEQELAIQTENEAYEIKKANAIKFGEETTEIERQHLNTLNDINLTAQQKQYATDKANTEAKIKLSEAEADAKKALLQKTSDVLNKGADLLGKNTAAGKAMAAAAALINTYQGITTELATKTVTPFEIGLKIANVAIIAATGFKAVKNILAVKVPGGGGGGSVPDGASAAGGGAPTAPSFNVVGASGTNQLAQSIGAQQQQPIRTYVVSNDVTTAQSLQRNIIESATIGG